MLDLAGDGDESHFLVSHFQEADENENENQEGEALTREMGSSCSE